MFSAVLPRPLAAPAAASTSAAALEVTPTAAALSAAPPRSDRPRHVAIIMDGNGRWATARHLPRVAGHTRGVESVRTVIEASITQGIEYLSLFAFSSENWRRPPDEVSVLMRLFVSSLQREIDSLRRSGVRLRVVGQLESFEPCLREQIQRAQQLSAGNTRLHLTVCASYGGRWDILQAARCLLAEQAAGAERPAGSALPEEPDFARHLALSFAPDPDLLIRTGGERRISNFLIWQLAYAELYFTDVLWPDFHSAEFVAALQWYAQRERRFGRTSEQLRRVG